MSEELIAKLMILTPLWGCAIGATGMVIDMATGFRFGAWTDRAGDWGARVAISCVLILGIEMLLALTMKALK